MITFFDFFSGGGGAAQGAKQAGLTPVGGVELDHAIAEIYTANHGDHLTVADVLNARPGDYDRPDWFHASPPCQNFSTAKNGGMESAINIACAIKVAEFIEAWRPQYFSLENVAGYARSPRSFPIIVESLHRAGYFPQWSILNAADYGVAQSRRRLILLAVRGGFVPPPPPPTPWLGWHEAIADLIPSLPESKLAKWQVKALPEWVRESVLVEGRNPRNPTIRGVRQPASTLPASLGKGYPRALLIHPTDQRTCPTPSGGDPAFTITSSMPQTGNYPRALLIENTGARSDRPLQVRCPAEPIWTIRAMGGSGHWHRATAIEEGRVVALTIPALARLQGFPDSYRWSGRKVTDGVAIGNSVCPLFFEGVIQNLLGGVHGTSATA